MDNNMIIMSSALSEEDLEDLRAFAQNEIEVDVVHVSHLMGAGDIIISFVINLCAAHFYETVVKPMLNEVAEKVKRKGVRTLSVNLNNGTPVLISLGENDTPEMIREKVDAAVEHLIG